MGARAKPEARPTNASAEAALQLMIEAGGLECSLADYWGAEWDGRTPGHRAALAVSRAAAEAYLSARGEGGERSGRGAREVATALARLQAHLPPPETLVPIGRPEGFRYYGLSPDAYIAPARRLAEEAGSRPVFVIGLRSIGSTLAALVAAVLRRQGVGIELVTLRPRGAPEDRHYAADAALRRDLQAWRGLWAIVDEGPGLSGSSFGGAVQWLEQLGAPSHRIVLMPSWDPPAARLSHTVVAQSWERWRKFPADPPAARPEAGTDLSAGRWRQELHVGGAIPVWPQQERLKFLSRDGRWIFKFGGLGAYGREAAERARLLAQAGFTAPARYLGAGWLCSPRMAVRPMGRLGSRAAARAKRWAEWTGRYLAFVRAHFACGPRQPPSAEMQRMVSTNLQRLLECETPLPAPEAVPLRVDGRMLRHEWGLRNGDFIKFDALEHGDDHFFPGPTDLAWDLAALEFEFGAEPARAAREEYARRSGDGSVAARLPWYRVAYGIYQAAFAEFAQELVGPPDREWFQQSRERYLRRVRRLLRVRG